MNTVTEPLPGIAVLVLGALTAYGLSGLVGVNELLLAVGVGVALANLVGVPDRYEVGIQTHKIWLAAGIVLLGALVSVDAIADAGGSVLAVMLVTVIVTLLVAEMMARNVAGLSERFGSLLAAGSSICGVSAVVAVGGAVRVRETLIAYAAGIVLLVDAVTILVYPVVGSVLDLSDVVFGVWAGASMLSTGPVVAVGFAYSEAAGQWATMTKLARNSLIGAFALGYASYYAHRGTDQSASLGTLWSTFPKFVLGFLVLIVLASAGAFSESQQATIDSAITWLFLLAFVGLGTEIQFGELRQLGLTPVLVVFGAVFVASLLSLGAALVLL